MVLITGANGITGRAVINALKSRNTPTRAMTTSLAAKGKLLDSGATEVVVATFEEPSSLDFAMRGVDTVFHIPPRMKPAETQNGLNIIAAAKRCGVRRIALHSVINSQIQAIRFHVNKRLVEEAAMISGLPWVIFQPTNYMQNVAWNWRRMMDFGEFVFPYSADVPISWLDLNDYAEGVARVLSENGFDYGVFEAVSSQAPLNRHQLAEIFSKATGKTIRAVEMQLDEYMALPHWRGRDPEEMSLLRTMFEEFHRHGAPGGNWRVLAMLLGREPTQYEAFAQRFISELN